MQNIKYLLIILLFPGILSCTDKNNDAAKKVNVVPQETVTESKEAATVQPKETETASQTNQMNAMPQSDASKISTLTNANNSIAPEFDLAKKSGCLACHKVDKKLVGPAWQDVAKRYVGDTKAKQRLITKVSKGGKGNWTEVTGGAAMPPYSPRVSAANIEKLVNFILSLPVQ